MASLNICGINTHIDELRLFIRGKGIHVLGINETELGEGFPDHLVYIDGFEIVRKDRDKLGGGVALYICDSVNFFTSKLTGTVMYRNPTHGRRTFLCSQLFLCLYTGPVFLGSLYTSLG